MSGSYRLATPANATSFSVAPAPIGQLLQVRDATRLLLPPVIMHKNKSPQPGQVAGFKVQAGGARTQENF